MENSPARVPPFDKSAEIAVLGAVLLDNQALPRIRGLVAPEDFYLEALRIIYLAMLDIPPGEPIDHVTLGSQLRTRGELEKIGGAAGLGKLTDEVATAANVEHYAKIVRRKAVVRRMIYACQTIAADGYSGEQEFEEYLSLAQSQVHSIAVAGHGIEKGPVRIGEGMMDTIDSALKNVEPAGLVKTGFASLDRTMGGLWPGEMVVLGARPKMGKSTLALNIAVNAAKRGRKVLIFSLEDSKDVIRQRLLSLIAGIDLAMIRRGRVSKERGREMIDAGTLIDSLPLWVEDRRGLTADQIVSISLEQESKHDVNLVIVDHGRRVRHLPKQQTREGYVYVFTTFADACGNMGIPWLVLHQLNRDLEKRGPDDKRPRESDLRESGTIEEDARAIWFLYRDSHYNDTANPNGAELIVARANHGPVGTIPMFVDLPKMFFADLAKETQHEYHDYTEPREGY